MSSKNEKNEKSEKKEESKLILFYSQRHKYGYFSNFAIYPITVNEIEFICNEQYIMYSKALLFKDLETARSILKAKTPTEMKRLGRSVRNFDQKTWNANVNNIADTCNLAKFSQHERLKSLLLETGDSIIAEASPSDAIWGIGVDEEIGRDMSKWRGTNILGKSLMRVRDLLREENIIKSSFPSI